MKGFAAFAASSHLTKEEVKDGWTADSTEKLRKTIITSLVLTYPGACKSFILRLRCHDEEIGGVLFQKYANAEQVEACFSKLTPTEKN